MEIIGVLMEVGNSHFYWMIALEKENCDFHEEPGYGHFTEYVTLRVHVFLSNLIPFVVMLVTNSAIIAKVTYANHIRKVQLNVDNDKKLSSMTINLFSIITVPVNVVNYIIKHRENTEQKQV